MRSDLDRFFLLTIFYQFDAVNIHIKFILFNIFIFYLNNNLSCQNIENKKEPTSTSSTKSLRTA
jgi:hypothetical protein